MKMNELSMLLDDLISCGNKLTETVKALKDYYSSPDEETEPKKKKGDTPKEEPPTKKPMAEPKTYTKVGVRAALGQKAKIEDQKYKTEVKALVVKYFADGTFTGIPEENFTELMTNLE